MNLIEKYHQECKPLHSLGTVEIKTLKSYIETNQTNGFIKLSKSPTIDSILFVKKPDGNLWFCVDYQDLNKLIIKNQYPLLFNDKSLDQLDQAKQFTYHNWTNAYHRIRIWKEDE